MSTKTTFKRVALVAVAALGFGLLSVIPSNAASANNDDFVSGSATLTTTTTTYAGRIGQEVAIPVSGTVAANDVGADDLAALSIAAAITSQPASSSIYASLTSRTTAFGTVLDIVNTGKTFDDSGAITTAVTHAGSATAVATLNYSSDTQAEDVVAVTTATTLATVKFTL